MKWTVILLLLLSGSVYAEENQSLAPASLYSEWNPTLEEQHRIQSEKIRELQLMMLRIRERVNGGLIPPPVALRLVERARAIVNQAQEAIKQGRRGSREDLRRAQIMVQEAQEAMRQARGLMEEARERVSFETKGFKNYYEILGVSRHDTHEEITKKAEKKLNEVEREVEIVRSSGSAERTNHHNLLEARYYLILEAISVITNEERRRLYDKQLNEVRRLQRRILRRVDRFLPKRKEMIRFSKYEPLHDSNRSNPEVQDFKDQQQMQRNARVIGLGTGTTAFMGAMLFHGMLRSWATDNPYMRYATLDSLKDPRGAGLLFSFGIMAGYSNHHLNRILQKRGWLKGPTNGPGMAIAVIGNHFLEKVFYSQGWNISYLYATEYMDRTREFYEKKTQRKFDLQELGIKAKRAHEIQEELLQIAELRRLSTANRATLQRARQLTLELNEINREYRHPYFNASFEALAEVAADAKRFHPGEWQELGWQVARLLVVIKGVDIIFHKVGEWGRKVKANKDEIRKRRNFFIRKLGDVARTMGIADLPKRMNISPFARTREQFARLQFLNRGAQASGRLLSRISQGIGLQLSRVASRVPHYVTMSFKSMPLQVLHGLAFLEGETQLKKLQDNVFKPMALRRKENNYRRKMSQHIAQFIQSGDGEDLEKINDLRKDWMQHWYKYDEYLLTNFYSRYYPWLQKFMELSSDYEKKVQYINWLLLGEGKFSDYAYRENTISTGAPWHQNKTHRVAFQQEVDKYEDFLRQDSPSVSLKVTEEGVEISGHNVESIKHLLAMEKRSVETRLEGERIEFLQYAQKFLESSYFDGKMPGLLNLGHRIGAFFQQHIQNRVFFGKSPPMAYYPNAPFSKMRSYQVQLDNLLGVYNDFLNGTSDFLNTNEQGEVCEEGPFSIEKLRQQQGLASEIMSIEDESRRASGVFDLAEHYRGENLVYSHSYSLGGEKRACVLSTPELRAALVHDWLVLDMYNTGFRYKIMPQEILDILKVDPEYEPVVANTIYSDVIMKSKDIDELNDDDGRKYFWSLEKIQEELDKKFEVNEIVQHKTEEEEEVAEYLTEDLQTRLDRKHFPENAPESSGLSLFDDPNSEIDEDALWESILKQAESLRENGSINDESSELSPFDDTEAVEMILENLMQELDAIEKEGLIDDESSDFSPYDDPNDPIRNSRFIKSSPFDNPNGDETILEDLVKELEPLDEVSGF